MGGAKSTAYAAPAPVRRVGVDRRHTNIAVTQRVVDRACIVSAFGEVSCECVAQPVSGPIQLSRNTAKFPES